MDYKVHPNANLNWWVDAHVHVHNSPVGVQLGQNLYSLFVQVRHLHVGLRNRAELFPTRSPVYATSLPQGLDLTLRIQLEVLRRSSAECASEYS